jgi:hypothetical protein
MNKTVVYIGIAICFIMQSCHTASLVYSNNKYQLQEMKLWNPAIFPEITGIYNIVNRHINPVSMTFSDRY